MTPGPKAALGHPSKDLSCPQDKSRQVLGWRDGASECFWSQSGQTQTVDGDAALRLKTLAHGIMAVMKP